MSDLNKIVNEIVGVVSESKKQRLSGPVSATIISVFFAYNYKLLFLLLYPQSLLPKVEVNKVVLKGLDARVKLISDYEVIFYNDFFDNIFIWTVFLLLIFLFFSFFNKLFEALQSKVEVAGKRSGGHVDIESIRREEFARAEGSVKKKLEGYENAMHGFDKTLGAINYVSKLQGNGVDNIKELEVECPELWKEMASIEEGVDKLNRIVETVKVHTKQHHDKNDLFFKEADSISTKVLQITGSDMEAKE